MSNYRNPNRRLRIVKEEDYYFMVEIPNLEHVNTFYMTERDNLKDLFKIEYTLEVQEKSFLHVGNGLVKFLENGGKDENRIDSKFKKERDGKTGLDFMRDEGGNPIIPGSSLKGH